MGAAEEQWVEGAMVAGLVPVGSGGKLRRMNENAVIFAARASTCHTFEVNGALSFEETV